jgi:hypothetical protein
MFLRSDSAGIPRLALVMNSGEGLSIQNGGNVGIGTTSPSNPFEVRSANSVTAGGHGNVVFADLGGNAGVTLGWYADGTSVTGGWMRSITSLPFFIGTAGAPQALSIANNGNVGIGTSDPQVRLHVAATSGYGAYVGTTDTSSYGLVAGGGLAGILGQSSQSRGIGVQGDSYGSSGTGVYGDGYLGVSGQTTGIPYGRGVFGLAVGATESYGGLFQYGTDGNNAAYLGGNGIAGLFFGPVTVHGVATVNVLTITGGSDVAEPFRMSTKDIPKGALVSIDEENPGHLKLSTHGYDATVAGIVSGANGVNPGISLHQEGVVEGGQNVALSGRVYALADASYGAIKPGDMLTTSDTPGHCMKVTDHAKAQGAIIGKAMSALKEGKGMVLVLVSLQ